jgi:trehalose 6-phosphate phosphatase
MDEPEPLKLDATALFLDLDGTLAPIAPTPQDVRPDPMRTALLRRLGERLNGRLGVISGRTLAEVDRILDGAVTAAAGVHGLQRRSADGRLFQAEPNAALIPAKAALAALAAGWPGLAIEDKGLSLGVHYRAVPAAADAVAKASRAIADKTGLTLQLGAMVAELRTAGCDKGGALRAFMAEPPFKGARPIFVGDDLTDEDGFAAARDLGGAGVLIGTERPTAALYRLADVAAVFGWLEAALGRGAAAGAGG